MLQRVLPSIAISRSAPVRERGSCPTLYYAIVFAVLALLGSVLGFVALSGTLAWIVTLTGMYVAVESRPNKEIERVPADRDER